MTIIYIVSAVWSLGCALGYIGTLRFMFTEGCGWLTIACAVTLGGVCALLLGVVPWAIIASAESPDLATLKKNEWFCSASHTEVMTVMAGKVPVVTSTEVCDQYNRK